MAAKKRRGVRVKWSPCGRFWFDEQAAQAAVDFFPRYLRLTEGEWAGRPFVLEPWQEHDIIRPLFGWKRKDGTRRYRRAYIWVPRKNGKTELAAGVGLAILLGDGEMGGQVYSIAMDKPQASIVFNKAVTMVMWSPELSKHLTPFTSSIFCPDLMASFKPLSGKAEGKHGLNMSGLVGDEVHEWRDGELYTFVHQSAASRRQPLEFMISTAGRRTGYGWETWNYCQKILSGEIDDPETLVVIYAADPDDDWTDPKVWAKANPNLGVSVKLEYLKSECAQAKELPRLENDFKRYHLNLWTEQSVRWLPLLAWDACEPKGEDGALVQDWRVLPEFLIGRTCFGGIDLSSTTDLTAYVLAFPPENEREPWYVIPRFFVPEERLMERARRDRVPYDVWAKQGALIATPGNVVDYAYIKRELFADAEKYRLEKIGIDRWNATQMAVEINAEGLEAVLFGQGYGSMNGPSKHLETLVIDKRLRHGGHPVLRWCAGNVAVEMNAAGDLKPSKAKSTERIDGIVALVEAIGVALTSPPPVKSYMESMDMVVL